MKVSLNTSYNNYNKASFCSAPKNDDAAKKKKEKRIMTADTKRVVSECTTVALGLTILYFAMKRNFHYNNVKNEEKKVLEQLKKQIPPFKINADSLKPFLQ